MLENVFTNVWWGFCFIFGGPVWHSGSQFLHQATKLRPCSGSTGPLGKSQTKVLRSVKKKKKKLTACDNSKKLQEKMLIFLSRGLRISYLGSFGVLGRGAGGGDKGTLVQAERRGYRPPEKPAGLPCIRHPATGLWKRVWKKVRRATTHSFFCPQRSDGHRMNPGVRCELAFI